jgi:hypothetical protein
MYKPPTLTEFSPRTLPHVYGLQVNTAETLHVSDSAGEVFEVICYSFIFIYFRYLYDAEIKTYVL